MARKTCQRCEQTRRVLFIFTIPVIVAVLALAKVYGIF